MKKKILKTIYDLGGFAPFHWVNRHEVLILTYHRFSNLSQPFKTSADEFTAHLEYLNKNNTVLPLNSITSAFEHGEKLPSNTVAITIDDGYADAYEIAFPILKKFELPATLFAITDFIEGKIWLWTDKMRYILLATKSTNLRVKFEYYDTIEMVLTDEFQKTKLAEIVNSVLKKLPNDEKERKILDIAASLDVEIPETPTAEFAALDWNMVCEMDANGLMIESHTVSHPMLTNIDEDLLEFELKISKDRLENRLDRKVELFCYPNGAFNENVWRSVEKNQYNCAVTTRYGFVENKGNKYLLNRIDAQSEIVDFAQSVSGFEKFKRRILGI